MALCLLAPPNFLPRRNWKICHAKLWGETRCIMVCVKMVNIRLQARALARKSENAWDLTLVSLRCGETGGRFPAKVVYVLTRALYLVLRGYLVIVFFEPSRLSLFGADSLSRSVHCAPDENDRPSEQTKIFKLTSVSVPVYISELTRT